MTSAELTEKLRSIVARATAITMSGGAGSDGAAALLDESSPLWVPIGEHAEEMLPVVTALARELAATLAGAPDAMKAERERFREAEAAARFDWLEPPPALVAFILLDAVERIRDHCAHKLRR